MGFSLFARRYSGYHESSVHLARTYAPDERYSYCSLFLLVLRCFTSQGLLHADVTLRISHIKQDGFPHSDTSGSKAINRLPETFRRLIASFFAILGQGIHRVLLCLSCGTLYTTIFCFYPANGGVHFDTPVTVMSRDFQLPMRIRMSKIQCLQKRKPPQGAVFERFATRGPYGLSAPKKFGFRFVDT